MQEEKLHHLCITSLHHLHPNSHVAYSQSDAVMHGFPEEGMSIYVFYESASIINNYLS
jgi:hypothetical protein